MIIQEGWTGQSRVDSCRYYRGHCRQQELSFPKDNCLLSLQFASDDDLVAEEEARWMNKEDYRAAWKKKGYEAPVGILG